MTVRYDRRELRKRLHLEEWILAQLTALYDCREEEIPELEIDVDELLEMESDGARSARVQEILVDCYKPTEAFVCDLLDKIRGSSGGSAGGGAAAGGEGPRAGVYKKK